MIKFCHATKKDFPVIQLIAYQTWPTAFGGILSPQQISYMLNMTYSLKSLGEQVVVRGHQFLLANTSEGCLGFASYETNYLGTDTTKVHKLYILPSAQGKGLGKRILQCVEVYALEKNNKRLSLNVNRYNDAVGFYERLGFKKLQVEITPIGSGFVMEDFVMEKQLEMQHLQADAEQWHLRN